MSKRKFGFVQLDRKELRNHLRFLCLNVSDFEDTMLEKNIR